MPTALRGEEFPALDKEAFSRLIAGYGFTMHNASGSSGCSELAELHKEKALIGRYKLCKSLNCGHYLPTVIPGSGCLAPKVIKDAA